MEIEPTTFGTITIDGNAYEFIRSTARMRRRSVFTLPVESGLPRLRMTGRPPASRKMLAMPFRKLSDSVPGQ